MAQYNIDPFGKMAAAERWISKDKLQRQQMQRQNALQDIQRESAQIGLTQAQDKQNFMRSARDNGLESALQQYPVIGQQYTAKQPKTSYKYQAGAKEDGTGQTVWAIDQSDPTRRIDTGVSPPDKQPLVSIGGDKQESEFGKTMGKGLATQFLDMQKDSAAAGTTKYRYRRAGQLVKSLATGATKPTELTAKRLAKSLGLDISKLGITDDVSGAEALKAMGIDLTMDVVQRTKGAVSNKEMDLFAQTAPGLGNTVEGNIIILEMADKMATLKQQIGKLARDYKSRNNGKFDEGFYDELDKFHKENPLFTGDIQARIDAIGGARETMQVNGETAIRAEDGNYYVNRDGEYYMVEE